MCQIKVDLPATDAIIRHTFKENKLMPMEHLNEHGELCQGYFCVRCGGGCGMYGHRDKSCTPNRVLVKKLNAINEAGSIEAYTFNKLQGKYDE